ncbi:MAG: DUF2867 domain-containing protein [Pseudomonadota bacterium]
MRVKRTRLSPDSALHTLFKPSDFLDCYSVRVTDTAPPLHEIARRLFANRPIWLRALLAIRDCAVTPFGLKTTASLHTDDRKRDSVAIGQSIGFMRVHAITDREILLGEDDRHLDFRLAVRREADDPHAISLATWVRTHNALGRAYLRIIEPFHIGIVRSQLAAIARSAKT